MNQRPKLEIELGEKVEVVLLFDQPKTGLSPHGEWYLYAVNHAGVEKSWFASDFAHKKMIEFSKGDKVSIEHKRLDDGRTVYAPELISQNKTTQNNAYEDNTDLNIKWGMAFNNATRLVSSIPLHNDEGDLLGRVKTIANIMPEMFKIACSMPDQDIKPLDDDTPF